MLTLHLPWHKPALVSQLITQPVKAWVFGMVDGRGAAGDGTVTVCCAKRTGWPSSSDCACAHVAPTNKTQMANLKLKSVLPGRELRG